MKKNTNNGDEVLFNLFIYPAFPVFLIVIGTHWYLGNPIWESLQYAILAAITGPFGVLFTLGWLADNFAIISWILGISVGIFLISGIMFILGTSGWIIYKKIKSLI